MFGRIAPGPAVSLTSTSDLFRQSHMVRSSSGQFAWFLDPPGAVVASFGGGSPPPHAIANSTTPSARFIFSLLVSVSHRHLSRRHPARRRKEPVEAEAEVRRLHHRPRPGRLR